MAHSEEKYSDLALKKRVSLLEVKYMSLGDPKS